MGHGAQLCAAPAHGVSMPGQHSHFSLRHANVPRFDGFVHASRRQNAVVILAPVCCKYLHVQHSLHLSVKRRYLHVALPQYSTLTHQGRDCNRAHLVLMCCNGERRSLLSDVPHPGGVIARCRHKDISMCRIPAAATTAVSRLCQALLLRSEWTT